MKWEQLAKISAVALDFLPRFKRMSASFGDQRFFHVLQSEFQSFQMWQLIAGILFVMDAFLFVVHPNDGDLEYYVIWNLAWIAMVCELIILCFFL